MVKQHELWAPRGARRKGKRLGRGNGSGRGTYAGRGMKGQQSRSGPGPRAGFEGGQNPLIQRLPTRRGFNNIFRKEYAIVNLGGLERVFESGATVTPERMAEARLVRNARLPVKVLGNGDLTKPLSVVAHRFSAQARERLLAAGGSAELVPGRERRRGKRGDAG